jgi:uncharacterized membrane protein YhhN
MAADWAVIVRHGSTPRVEGVGWIALGAGIFLVSDALIGIRGFVRELEWAKLPIVATYHVGQGLIAVGVLRLVT